MKIQFINFLDIKLNLKECESQELSFIYKGANYSINIVYFNNNLYVYKFKEFATQIEINTILKGSSIDIVFCQESLNNDKDLSLDTLLTKYKLGVIEYA